MSKLRSADTEILVYKCIRRHKYLGVCFVKYHILSLANRGNALFSKLHPTHTKIIVFLNIRFLVVVKTNSAVGQRSHAIFFQIVTTLISISEAKCMLYSTSFRLAKRRVRCMSLAKWPCYLVNMNTNFSSKTINSYT